MRELTPLELIERRVAHKIYMRERRQDPKYRQREAKRNQAWYHNNLLVARLCKKYRSHGLKITVAEARKLIEQGIPPDCRKPINDHA